MEDLDGTAPAQRKAVLTRMTTPFHEAFRVLSRLDAPIVTAAHGVVAGGGLGYVYAADLVLAAESTRFVTAFGGIGLSGDGGGTWHLPRIIGLGRALELMLTGELVHADDALRMGLVNRVFAHGEAADRAHAFARAIASGPPLVHRAIKRAVYAGLDGDLAAALDREATGQLQLLASRDFAEGVTAFLQKREPKFEGR